MTAFVNLPDGRPARDLNILKRTSRLFNEPLELHEAVRRVITVLAESLDTMVVMWIPDPRREHLVPWMAHHADPVWLTQLNVFLHAHPLDMQASLTGQAFTKGQDMLVPVTADEPSFTPIFREQLGIQSFLTATIYSRGQMLGMLSAGRLQLDRPFDENDLAVVRAVADQAANAMANARFLEAEVGLRQRAETLLKIAKTLRSDLSLPVILQDAVDVTWQFLRPSFVGIFLLDEVHRFHLAAASELEAAEQAPRWPAADPGSLLGRILRGQTPMHLVQLDLEPMLEAERHLIRPDAATGCSAVPLYHQGTPNGVLLLLWRHEPATHEVEDLELVTGIAELIALAIENQRLVQQEASTHAARLMAEEIAKEREALIRQIVHDLRNSTQAISLINEEIELAAPDQPAILYGVSAIDRQITFISSFLKEKLNWVRRLPSDPAAGTPDVAALVARIGAARGAMGHQHVLEVEAVPAGIRMPLAESHLASILEELLENACKFTPAGGHVRLWCALSDGWITFYVADDGPGIPPDQQARIGETGFRLHDALPGEGQGLARIKHVATQGGGLFGFNSHPGEGSTFYVTLPTTRWGRADPPA